MPALRSARFVLTNEGFEIRSSDMSRASQVQTSLLTTTYRSGRSLYTSLQFHMLQYGAKLPDKFSTYYVYETRSVVGLPV